MHHPHPDKAHVMRSYRKYLLAFKKSNGSARSLVHYREMIEIYREAKRSVIRCGSTLR